MPTSRTPRNHHHGVDPRSSSPATRVTRRRALGISGLLGLTGALAACGSSGDQATASASPSPATGTAPTGSANEQLTALLDEAPRCTLTKEETQGPYWFDVDSIRSDIREDRQGLPTELALRVQDVSQCTADPSAGGIANAVVEVWHCDAEGVYSGFESGAPGTGGAGAPPEGTPPKGTPPGGTPPEGAPPGGPPPGGAAPGGQAGGETSDGSYSVGDAESTPIGDDTFLRGAQTTDANGIARFTTVYPGWYSGRAVHIHIKVHIDKKTVLTTQLFFDDDVTDSVYSSTAPYNTRGARDTRNDADTIYDPTGLAVTKKPGDSMLVALNLGVDA